MKRRVYLFCHTTHERPSMRSLCNSAGPLPPAIMDQLAAAAAQYAAHPGSHHVVLGSSQPHLQPQPPQQLSSLPPQPPHHHVHHIAHRPNVTDVAVQTDVTTIVQSKQVSARSPVGRLFCPRCLDKFLSVDVVVELPQTPQDGLQKR